MSWVKRRRLFVEAITSSPRPGGPLGQKAWVSFGGYGLGDWARYFGPCFEASRLHSSFRINSKGISVSSCIRDTDFLITGPLLRAQTEGVYSLPPWFFKKQIYEIKFLKKQRE